MSDQLSTSINVDNIPADDRSTLERLLGKQLDRGQQVFISTYTPGSTPSAEVKADAKLVIDAILAKAHQHLKDRNVPDVELESAIDEAIANARGHR